MGKLLNIVTPLHKKSKRDYVSRMVDEKVHCMLKAKEYEFDYWDGDRRYGYGGYKYDGRWKAVVERMRQHYNLPNDAAVLDVGCGKGFMLHDFKEIIPDCSVAGVDVSEYAIENSMPSVKQLLKVASAEKLPYPDKSFDLVISINSIHNLPLEACKTALQEIERVSRGGSFITVDAWRNDQEHEDLLKWVLTAETYMHVDDWKKLFDEIGFSGDYYWFIAD